MATFVYYLIAIVSGTGLVGLGLLFNRKDNGKFNKYLKVVSLIIGAVFLVRYMLGADAIQNMFKLGETPIANKFLNLCALFLVWFSYASALLVSMYGFYAKYIKNYIKY